MVVFLAGGDVLWSREVPVTTGEELVDAVATSLPLLHWPDCEAVWVSGDEATRYITTMPDTLGAALSEPPWDPAMAAAIQALPDEERATGTLALGVAAGRRHVALDLLPEGLRPRTWTGAQIATAAMLALALGSGIAALSVQGYRDQRHVETLETAARGLDSQVKEVERVAADVARKKAMLSAMQSAERGGLRALPLLRELTELLPQDAWLSQLNADVRGVELVGQANAASQLIPLLEASGWLERAEFTSPVTRGRDREQFRLRAGWEAGPTGPLAPRTADLQRPEARPDALRPGAERATGVERPAAPAGAERAAGPGGARMRGPAQAVPGQPAPGADAPMVVNPPAQCRRRPCPHGRPKTPRCGVPGGSGASHGEHVRAGAQAGGTCRGRERSWWPGYLYVVEPIQDANRQAAELLPDPPGGARAPPGDDRQEGRAPGRAGRGDQAGGHRVGPPAPGPTAPLAASELQKLVKDVASEANVEVRSERVLTTADKGGLLEVPIEITVAGWNPGVGRPHLPPRADRQAPDLPGPQAARDLRGPTPRSPDHDHRCRLPGGAARAGGQGAGGKARFRVRQGSGEQGIIDPMSRRLLALNLVLLAVIAVSGYWIVRELTTPRAVPQAAAPKPGAQPTAGAADAPSSAPRPEQRPLYNVIAAKNLFSATRTESTAPAAVAATPPPKLYLHGVIVDETKSRAFIEDVTAKSTFGYAVGDAVGGGRLEVVRADRVVIARPEGPMEVMLRDPSKPQPAPVAGTPGAPGVPGAPTPPVGAAAVRPGTPRAPLPPAAAASIQGVQPPTPAPPVARRRPPRPGRRAARAAPAAARPHPSARGPDALGGHLGEPGQVVPPVLMRSSLVLAALTLALAGCATAKKPPAPTVEAPPPVVTVQPVPAAPAAPVAEAPKPLPAPSRRLRLPLSHRRRPP